WVHARGGRAYGIVVLTTSLALLTKRMAVTLPLVLLLLDGWPLRRLSWRSVAEKLPLVALAPGPSLPTFLAQRAEGAVAIDRIPFGARLANAIVAYVRYLVLTVWPSRLAPWYSHPAVEGPALSPWGLAGAAVVLVTVTALALVTARRRPWLAV